MKTTATALGTSPFGTNVNDISQDGLDPDPENDGPGDNNDPTLVTFTESPRMGIAKTATNVLNNNDGTYNVTYDIRVVNMGNVPLTNVQVSDNLVNTFVGSLDFDVVSVNATAGLSVNTLFNGVTDTFLLQASSSNVAFADTGIITLVVNVTPGTKLGVYLNSANGTATGTGGTPVSDISQNGTNPDPDRDGNPNNNSQPTPVSFTENPRIEVEKDIFGIVDNNNDSYTVTYDITVTNTGNVPLRNVQVVDDLAQAFAAASGYTVNSTSILQQPSGTTFNLNGSFNGGSNINLLTGSDTLLVGSVAIIRLVVTVSFSPGEPGGPYINSAVALGTSPAGARVLGIGDAETFFFENVDVSITKELESVVDNGNETQRVTFKITIENLGDVPLQNLAIYDDILTQFAAFNPTNFSAEEGLSLFTNPNWNGSDTSNILEAGQAFDPEIEDEYFVFISFDVAPGLTLSQLNEATVAGNGPLGNPASDSDTASAFFLQPELTLVKEITSGAVFSIAGDTIFYSFTIINTGEVAFLGPFTVVDDKIGTLSNCAAGPLMVGDSVSCTAFYLVSTNDVDDGFVKNIAVASTEYINVTVSSNTDSAIAIITPNTTYAVNDENSTWEEVPVGGNVLTNDFDLEGHTQTFGSFLNAAGTADITSGSTVSGIDSDGNPVANAGTLTFDSNGNYTFTPAAGFTGVMSVPYRICDDGNPTACDTAFLDITVSPFPYNDNSVIANNDEYFTSAIQLPAMYL
jgi:uncharacterized repeat protein (TIGR01451 family)